MKLVVSEAEVEGVRRVPPRVSKLLLHEGSCGVNNVSLGVNVTEVGSRIPEHSHEGHEEVMYVVSGKGLFVVNGAQEYPVSAGCALYAPPGIKHELVNCGDEPLKIVWVYSPPLPEHRARRG